MRAIGYPTLILGFAVVSAQFNGLRVEYKSISNFKSPGDACGCAGLVKKPVCGTDGHTYNNLCELKCANQHAESDDKRCCKETTCHNYIGKETLDGKCKKWADNKGIYPSKPDPIRDENFPDGSLKKAANFCRNPDNGTSGLWCYTGVGKPLLYERCVSVPPCGVSVAHEGECRTPPAGG